MQKIAEEISRIESAKGKILTHLKSLGIANGKESLDELALMVETLGLSSGGSSDYIFDGIELKPPTKTDYTLAIDDELDLSGAKVLARYYKDVTTSAVFSPPDGAKLETQGTNTLSASYTENDVTKSDSMTFLVAENKAYVVYGEDNAIQYFTDINNVCDSSQSQKVGATMNVGGKSILKSDIKEIHLKDKFTDIPNNFAYNCTNLTVVDGLGGVATIGTWFMNRCEKFNYPLQFPSGLKSIGYNFMAGCTSFNQPIALPDGLTTLSGTTNNGYFMAGCTSFNQPITLPDSITNMGQYFLSGCSAFNQPVRIPSGVTTLLGYFLNSCTSFNQPLTIPGTLSTLNVTSFMYCCNAMVSPITVEIPYPGYGNTMLSTTLATAPCYVQGIPIVGTYASEWKSKIPNRTASPYRKLV